MNNLFPVHLQFDDFVPENLFELFLLFKQPGDVWLCLTMAVITQDLTACLITELLVNPY